MSWFGPWPGTQIAGTKSRVTSSSLYGFGGLWTISECQEKEQHWPHAVVLRRDPWKAWQVMSAQVPLLLSLLAAQSHASHLVKNGLQRTV